MVQSERNWTKNPDSVPLQRQKTTYSVPACSIEKNISSRFSRISEAFASEFLENLEEVSDSCPSNSTNIIIIITDNNGVCTLWIFKYRPYNMRVHFWMNKVYLTCIHIIIMTTSILQFAYHLPFRKV